MMGKSLNYAYPQKFAEGGDVASEQKSTSYAFVDADGNSYNMGDNRPGHDGTSLERAIANVQEYYDFAPGSFTVSVPSEERLVGTYDSASGSFQAATSDMRDLNGFSAMGEEDAPFAEPTMEEIRDRLDLFPDSITPPPPPPVEGGAYGGELVEYNGQMVPKKALDALKMAVGLIDKDTGYDVNNDGRIGADDALDILKNSRNAQPPAQPPAEVMPIEPGGDFGLPPFQRLPEVMPIEPGGDFGLPAQNPFVRPDVGGRTYGTYTPPAAPETIKGDGYNRTYGQMPPAALAPTFMTPVPQNDAGVLDPLREGLGSLFDRAKSLQGQSTYSNPFLRPGG